MGDIITAIGLLIFGWLGWQYMQYGKNVKEREKDVKTIAKITEKYSADTAPDLSNPVNQLLDRLRRKD